MSEEYQPLHNVHPIVVSRSILHAQYNTVNSEDFFSTRFILFIESLFISLTHYLYDVQLVVFDMKKKMFCHIIH